jgi:hypothetical protein
MAKYLRLFMAFVLLSGLFGISSEGNADMPTFFGPEVFVRGKGAPVTETIEFYATGYQAPYILHLRNGDGDKETAVSSAWIWLNGNLLFGPSSFSKKVSAYDIFVPLQESNSLSVRLASNPGSKLTIWIEGVQISQNIIVFLDDQGSASSIIAPELGGSIETFGPDGTKYLLTIPPNALVEEREITITPIVNIVGLPLPNGMLTAVQFEPDGLRLLEPATLTIELPFQAPSGLVGFLFNNNGEGFHLFPTEANSNTLSFSLFHFSSVGAALIDCEQMEAFDVVNWLTQEDRAKQRIALLNAFIENNCESLDVDAAARALMEIHYDWFYDSAGVSTLLIKAQTDPEGFLDHAISQLNSWYLSLQSSCEMPSCNPNLFPFAQPFDCGHPDGFLCTNLDDVSEAAAAAVLRAFRQAVINANNRCAQGQQSNDEEAIEILRKACILEIDWSFLYSSAFDFEELMALKTCGIWTLEITPNEKTIAYTESLQLSAIAKDITGKELGERAVSWNCRDGNIATIGDNGLLTPTGIEAGTARARAFLYAYGCPLCEGDANIEVICANINIDQTELTLLTGESKPIVVTVDECGEIVQNPDLVWTVPVGGIEVDLTNPTIPLITGVCPGHVTLTVEYKEISKSIDINVEIESIRITPESKTIFNGMYMLLYVYDQSNNLVPNECISWTIPEGGIVSVDPATPLGSLEVFGVNQGDATLIATVGGVSAQATIHVVRVGSVTLSPVSVKLGVYQSIELIATVRDVLGNIITLESGWLHWASFDNSIAIVSPTGIATALVMGISPGYTGVIATFIDRSGITNVTVER